MTYFYSLPTHDYHYTALFLAVLTVQSSCLVGVFFLVFEQRNIPGGQTEDLPICFFDWNERNKIMQRVCVHIEALGVAIA